MLRWLSNWWNNQDRKIFLYWDGTRKRRGDPMVLLRGLQTRAGFDLETAIRIIDGGANIVPTADFWEHVVESVDAARAVFGVQSLEDGGLTEGEMLGLLYDFLLFMDALKKNGSTSPISSEPTGWKPSGDSHTKDASGSGSIFAASNSDGPHASSRESPPL